MTVTEIVNETVEYYSTHPRAYNSETLMCEYITAQGNKCAVGRCVSDDAATRWQFNGLGQIDNIERNTLEDALLPQYRGHSREFWNELQHLHDREGHWNGNKLSPAGEMWRDHIIEHYEKHSDVS